MVWTVVEIVVDSVELVASRISVEMVGSLRVFDVTLHVLSRAAFADVVADDVECLLDGLAAFV